MPLPQTNWEKIVDRAMQTCVNVFGDGPESVIITHYGGTIPPYAVDGIFEAQSEVVDPGTQLKVISNQPQISFRVSVLQQMPDQDDEFLIRGIVYRADSPIFDGHGTVTVPLGRMS
jgi:hypothetical protein